MKLPLRMMLAAVLMILAFPAYSGTALQVWNCGMEEGVTEEDLHAKAKAWVAAARKVDGGENIEVYVLFPVAVNAAGETDFAFVVTTPTFAEWGKFWDAYPDSDAADLEGQGTFCPDSMVWESVKVE